MVALALVVLAATTSTAQAGECYCSCCGWCHMSECYNNYNCCGGSDGVAHCSMCDSLEETLALNATRILEAAKAVVEEEVPVKEAVTFEAAVESGGCWNSQCTNSNGDWGWCENCGTSPLSDCCPPEETYDCVDGKNCKCRSYGGGNGGCSARSVSTVPVEEEVALEAAVEAEAEAQVTGDCYCSCCNWCHMKECFDGHSCCDDKTCSGCGTLEEDLALNATRFGMTV